MYTVIFFFKQLAQFCDLWARLSAGSSQYKVIEQTCPRLSMQSRQPSIMLGWGVINKE